MTVLLAIRAFTGAIPILLIVMVFLVIAFVAVFSEDHHDRAVTVMDRLTTLIEVLRGAGRSRNSGDLVDAGGVHCRRRGALASGSEPGLLPRMRSGRVLRVKVPPAAWRGFSHQPVDNP